MRPYAPVQQHSYCSFSASNKPQISYMLPCNRQQMSEATQHQITDIPIGRILSHGLYSAKYDLLFVEIFENVRLLLLQITLA